MLHYLLIDGKHYSKYTCYDARLGRRSRNVRQAKKRGQAACDFHDWLLSEMLKPVVPTFSSSDDFLNARSDVVISTHRTKRGTRVSFSSSTVRRPWRRPHSRTPFGLTPGVPSETATQRYQRAKWLIRSSARQSQGRRAFSICYPKTKAGP